MKVHAFRFQKSPCITSHSLGEGSFIVGHRSWMNLIVAFAMTWVLPAFSQSHEVESVKDDATVRLVRSMFEQRLHQYGITATLGECSHMKLLRAGKDTSYGAVCEMTTTDKSAPILICDDRLIGRMTASFSGFVISDKSVANFMKMNCPPGG